MQSPPSGERQAMLRAAMALGATASFPDPLFSCWAAGAAAAATTATSAPTASFDASSLHQLPGLDEWMLASGDYAATLQAPGASQLPQRRQFLNSTPRSTASVTQSLMGTADVQDAIAGLNAMTLASLQQWLPTESPPTLAGQPRPRGDGSTWAGLDGSTPAPPPLPSIGGSGLLGVGSTTSAATTTTVQVMAATTAADTASLYVSGLPPDTTELQLYQAFAPHGALQSCKVKADPATGLCSGIAFVNFVRKEDAQRAMQAHDCSGLLGGRQLHITRQAPRKVRAASAASKAAVAAQQRQEQLLQKQLRKMLTGAAAPPPPPPRREQQGLGWEQQLLRNVVTGVQPVVVTPQAEPQLGASLASQWILGRQGAGNDVVGAGQPLAPHW